MTLRRDGSKRSSVLSARQVPRTLLSAAGRSAFTLALAALTVDAIVDEQAHAAEPGRPSTVPLPLPDFPSDEPGPRLLPDIPPPLPDSSRPPAPAADAGARVVVRRFVFRGNSVVGDADLARAVAPFTNRPLDGEGLVAARDAVTLVYLERGYLTSGAILPEQESDDGTILIEIVESRITRFETSGRERLRETFLRRRLGLALDGPLHVPRLEARLRRLQRDPRIARVDAQLLPTNTRGEARLRLAIEERTPFRSTLEANNYLAPSLGHVRGRVSAEHLNVSGYGDTLRVLGGAYEGGGEIEASYRVPVSRFGTEVALSGRWSTSDLLDRLGDELEIEGDFWSTDLDLRQPLVARPDFDFATGLIGSLRQSDTELAGEPFDEVGGRTRVFALRFYQDLLYRGRDRIVAGRSTVSFGLDALGATRSSQASIPDGEFVAWLLQTQWLERFSPLRLELLVRAELQLASDPLLSLERYSSGGRSTVRGYRENQLIRDQGGSASAELRIPVFSERIGGRPILQLAPFVDVGVALDRRRFTNREKTLLGAGLAVRFAPKPFVRAELAWASRLTNVPQPRGLQGDGLHLGIVIDLDPRLMGD